MSSARGCNHLEVRWLTTYVRRGLTCVHGFESFGPFVGPSSRGPGQQIPWSAAQPSRNGVRVSFGHAAVARKSERKDGLRLP